MVVLVNHQSTGSEDSVSILWPCVFGKIY